jgi:hypothetical protein
MRSKTTRPRTALILACTLPLASCASSTRLVVIPASLAAAPDARTYPCDAPVALPETGLNVPQILRYWGRDRVALADCRDRQARLAAFVPGQGGQTSE